MSVITLPRSAVKEITDEYVIVEISEKFEPLSGVNLDVIKKARGSISKEKTEEWLKEIEVMRDEWERF